ncbi:hypothetical protein [Microbacterium halimionae]|nr:hypothetical protein [Microbacterium halimionae]
MDSGWRRFGYALEASPGLVLQLVGSAVAWTFVQLSGMMVAGCGPERPCNHTLTDLATNGIQPALLVAWAITAVLVFAVPLVWGRSPLPVLLIGIGVSALLTVVAYVTLSIGAGVM